MKYNIKLTQIKKDIEEMFEIQDIADRYRGQELVMSRYLYYILSKKFTFKSLKEIGKLVGRDHTSVIHGLNKYDELIRYFEGHKYAQDVLEKKYNNIKTIVDSEFLLFCLAHKESILHLLKLSNLKVQNKV